MLPFSIMIKAVPRLFCRLIPALSAVAAALFTVVSADLDAA